MITGTFFQAPGEIKTMEVPRQEYGEAFRFSGCVAWRVGLRPPQRGGEMVFVLFWK